MNKDSKLAGFKIVKNVTLPLLKMKAGLDPYFLRFESAMALGRAIKDAGKDSAGKTKQMEPPFLAHVVELSTGEEMQIICPAVMRSTLDEEYPDNAYVGKSFQVTISSIEGKKYNMVTLAEIEMDDIAAEITETRVAEAAAKPARGSGGKATHGKKR